MPMQRHLYPPEWEAISQRIRFERAAGKCEDCGAEHGQPNPRTGSKVVLTVHHVGATRDDGTPGDPHDKSDCRDVNLRALCQACHLAADLAGHIRRARETRYRKKNARMGLLPFTEEVRRRAEAVGAAAEEG